MERFGENAERSNREQWEGIPQSDTNVIMSAHGQQQDYSEWTHLDILNWILSVEDGLFVPYMDTLSKSFSEEHVNGSHLNDLDKADNKSLGVKDFEHKQLLFKHIKILITSDRCLGDTAYM